MYSKLGIDFLSHATIATNQRGQSVEVGERTGNAPSYSSHEAAVEAARLRSARENTAFAVVAMQGDHYVLTLKVNHQPYHLGDDSLSFETIRGKGEYVVSVVDGGREIKRTWTNTPLGDQFVALSDKMDIALEYNPRLQIVRAAIEDLFGPVDRFLRVVVSSVGDWVLRSEPK